MEAWELGVVRTRVSVARTRVGVARNRVGGGDAYKRKLLRSVVLANGRLGSVKASPQHSRGVGRGASGGFSRGVNARDRLWHDSRCDGRELWSSSFGLVRGLLAVAVWADSVLGPHATLAHGAVMG